MPQLKGIRDQYGMCVVTQPATFIKTSLKDKNRDSVVRVYGTPGTTVLAGGADGCELTQGVLKVEFYREAGYPFLTTGATTAGNWGGAEDTALNVVVGNSAANTYGRGGMRGLRVYCRQYSGGNMANMYGAMISCDDRGTADASGKTVAKIWTLYATTRINGVCATQVNTIVAEDNGQGTINPATAATDSIVLIRTSGTARASGAVFCGLCFEKSGSSSGITNAFGFASSDGSEGAYLYAGTITGSGNSVRIKIDVAGTAYYLIARASVDH